METRAPGCYYGRGRPRSLSAAVVRPQPATIVHVTALCSSGALRARQLDPGAAVLARSRESCYALPVGGSDHSRSVRNWYFGLRPAEPRRGRTYSCLGLFLGMSVIVAPLGRRIMVQQPERRVRKQGREFSADVNGQGGAGRVCGRGGGHWLLASARARTEVFAAWG